MAGHDNDFDEDDYETEPPSLRELERLIPKLTDRDGDEEFGTSATTDSGLFDLSASDQDDDGPLFDAPPAAQGDAGLLFDAEPAEGDDSLLFDPAPAPLADEKSPFGAGTGGFERLLRMALLLAVVGGIAWFVANNSADKGADGSAPGIAEDAGVPAGKPATDIASADAATEESPREARPETSAAGQSTAGLASQSSDDASTSADSGEASASGMAGDSGIMSANPVPSTGQLPDDGVATTAAGTAAVGSRTASPDAAVVNQELASQQPGSASVPAPGTLALPLNQAPPVNKEGFGTLGEVRWCVFESKRLDYLKAQLRYDVLQNLYTERAASYNQRCPGLTGTDADWQRAESEFRANAETIRAEASAIQSQWAQSVVAPLVRDVQGELARLGYYSGAADGIYTGSTAAAVNSFTAANGLPATDQPSYELLGYLKSQASRGAPPLQPRVAAPALHRPCRPAARSAGGVTPAQRRAIESTCAAAKAQSEELNDQCWSEELRKLGL